MKHFRRMILVAVFMAGLLVYGTMSGLMIKPAQAQGLGDIIKIGGIVLAVSVFGNQLNNFINSALGQRQAAVVGATKVVPIFSVGRGLYVGAAQVMGLPANVRTVQGVAALDISLGNLNGTALVPISTRSASRTSLSRVSGVGVSAVIDFRI